MTRCYHKSHSTSKRMRASGFPESLCVVVPLHCVTVCMCAKVRLHFLCVFAWETIRVHVTVTECMVDCYGCTSLELVHYSLTVFPSEIPGIGCVTHKHMYTQNTHTNTNRKMHTFRFTHARLLFCILVLHRVTSSKSELLCPRRGDGQVERLLQGTERNHCHVFYSKIT